MTYQILNKYRGMSGTWEVRVKVSEEESVFFSFQEDPSQEQVDLETTALMLRRQLAQLGQNGNGPGAQTSPTRVVSVTRRQFIRALHATNMYSLVTGFIAQAPLE